MTVSTEYKRQLAFRPWAKVFEALPTVSGQTVLDLGCGMGDQLAELVARGARVIGVDLNDELLAEARERQLAGAELRKGDLREPLDLGVVVDGIWCSFTAAYLPEPAEALASWARHLRPGGWIALTEIDDLFGHEPLDARTRALLDAYARESLAAGRYDFHMGHKLSAHLERAGFAISKTLTFEDQELSFEGPAPADVLDAWRNRLDRMKLLQDFCGAELEHVRESFIGCLARPDHRSVAKVYCCIGFLRGAPQ
jgi:SAM-dependent methyltransferase